MKHLRKALSMVLILVMLVSTLMMPALALEYNPTNTTGPITFTAEADKTVVNPGDVVTITFSVATTGTDDFGAGTYIISYPKNLIDADQTNGFRTWLGSAADWNKEEATIQYTMAANAVSRFSGNYSAEELAYYTGHLSIAGQVKNDGSATNAAGSGWQSGEFMSIEMKVAEDAAPGSEIWVGMHEAGFKGSMANIYSPCKTTKNTAANINANSMVKLTVATEEEKSIVNPLKGQMRYGATEGTYDVRALAVITGADFDATFGDIATAKSRITEIGFVFAAGENVTAPSMDAVKNVVKNYADKEGDGTYVKKTISQISTAIQPGDYVFSCIVPGVSNEDAQKNSLVAVGYILYTDADGNAQEAYYPAAQTIDFADYYKA